MDRIEDGLTGAGWQQIVDRLSGGRNPDEWARSSGALVRSHAIEDGESLLRLALVYGGRGKSLKQSCLWAASQGLAGLSDEALLKRLGKAAPRLHAHRRAHRRAIAPLRPTGNGDTVQALWWNGECWGASGPFGIASMAPDRTLDCIANEPDLWINA